MPRVVICTGWTSRGVCPVKGQYLAGVGPDGEARWVTTPDEATGYPTMADALDDYMRSWPTPAKARPLFNIEILEKPIV